MTNDDYKYDADDLSPLNQQRLPLQRVALLGAALLSTVGLAGYTAARHLTLPAEVAAIPHLLGASVLVLGAGVGLFALLFNYFFNPVVNARRAKKVGSVYVTVLGLTSLFVDAGTFHPRLAVVFLLFLCVGAVMYALFRSEDGFDTLNA